MPLNPDKQHPDYVDFKPVWSRCRDATIGKRAIKEGKETYLKKLAEQKSDEYAAYLDRVSYFNATDRTVDTMLGCVVPQDYEGHCPGFYRGLAGRYHTIPAIRWPIWYRRPLRKTSR